MRKINTTLLALSLILILSLTNCAKNGKNPPPSDVGKVDPTASLTTDEILDIVQKRSFGYFWGFAEPLSGLARERSQDNAYGGQSPKLITIGGSGFGIACLPVAVKRGWIKRSEAVKRLKKILTFLESCDKYHGAFSHWYYGNTGKTRPFSNKDDGGDIVETAFLIQGLLINRQYFSGAGDEKDIRTRITKIWEAVEWDWYTNKQKSLTWHWSPNYGFQVNLKVNGWNEGLIAYVLAAASPTHHIDKKTYIDGWTRNGNFRNGATYYGHLLPVGPKMGGPLFFAHYSFIGLDPRNLKDGFVDNYFEQNKAHTLINYDYCKANPKRYKGYGEKCWGLTASESKNGYKIHSPTNDLGVISPTAALSSFPYTPVESEKALRYFYGDLKQKLWGKFGFYDAFSEQYNWYADGYLAVDQGPIVAMIENYRTQLLWNLFMADKDVSAGLKRLGFSSPHIK